MYLRTLLFLGAVLAVVAGVQRVAHTAAPVDPAHFSIAPGWANTQGGRGGEILRVTTLDRDGPGSLRAAIETAAPRIIVFEVSGVIDLGLETLTIRHPFVTIAGQTAPPPGITLIRGGIDVETHDVIISHLRVRPGDGGKPIGDYESDAIETRNASFNVIIDHCSLTWATDENLSAAGPQLPGRTPEEWRSRVSHKITFNQNLIAEALWDSSGRERRQGSGSLVEDNVNDILIYGNLYAHNPDRNPLFKGGSRGAVVNNLIYNPVSKGLYYVLLPGYWAGFRYELGMIAAVGNVLQAGPSTSGLNSFFRTVSYGDVEYFGYDNVARTLDGGRYPEITDTGGRFRGVTRRVGQPPLWPPMVQAMPSGDVEEWVLRSAGARPWDRDEHDRRIIDSVRNRSGRVIDSQEEVGGYPRHPVNRRPFEPAEWNLETMVPHSGATLR